MPARQISLPIPNVISNFFSGRENYANASARIIDADEDAAAESSTLLESRNFDTIGASEGDENHLVLKVCPEAWRFVAYVFFWGMCGFAIAANNILVAPKLLKGSPTNSECPPWGPGGEGFDVHTNSHLQRLFGFNNICVNWDYSPSRELTALVYPLFEYSLLVYLCLDFTTIAVSYKKGYIKKWFWTVACIVFPIQLLLCAWFRMIFVIRAYEDVQGHTAGFLGLQIALALVAILNVAYVVETKVYYSFMGGIRGTRIAARVYLFCNAVVSCCKLYLTMYVVAFGIYPEFAKGPSPLPGRNIGQLVDLFWMIMNAVLPVIISFLRARTEKPLEITIGLAPPKKIADPATAAS